jgi:hypothetical protein
MSTENILSLLISERDKLNGAIEALGEPVKHRGLPPKKPLAATFDYNAPNVPDSPIAKKKRKMSAAARKAIGDATRKRWAALRKAKAKG